MDNVRGQQVWPVRMNWVGEGFTCWDVRECDVWGIGGVRAQSVKCFLCRKEAPTSPPESAIK